MQHTDPYVHSQIDDKGIAHIEFFHPSHNSLPGNILANLAGAITDAGNNDTVKIIVLRSGGNKTFCAGASFDELVTINDFETGKKFFSGFANVINACRSCGKIVIGRVQGKAVGGGVGLASAVDYCLATKSASAKLSELVVGIGPFVVGPAVQRKIGLSAFSQMALDAATFYSADWAKNKGLYTEIYDDIISLDQAVSELANRLASSNLDALSLLKKIFWEGTEDWDDLLISRAELSGRLVLSEYTKIALAGHAK
jgi:methylglutaconyl-CoA hydratase